MAVHVERRSSSRVQSWAPGRVTFVGDHTDYNFGLSLAAPLPRGTRTTISLSAGDDVFKSADGSPGWQRYLDACVRLVRESGVDLPPVRIDVESDLPIGKGLSSSASLVSATLAGLYALADIDCSADQLAECGRQVENEYLGIPTGTLDQAVIVHGSPATTVLVDFGRGTATTSPLPVIAGYQFLVVDPGLPRQLGRANFGVRRAECEEAISRLCGSADREAWLAFREGPDLELGGLPAVLRRRLVHVASENGRVRELEAALEAADADAIAEIITRSHESLRDDFEVSTPELERARSVLLHQPGVLAARVVGAGFGGCLLAFAADDAVVLDFPWFDVR